MRQIAAFLVVFMMNQQVTPSLAADSLFSQVPIQSVFAPPGTPAVANTGSEKPSLPPLDFSARKPASGGQISELLRTAGFETREIAERTLSTTAKTDTSAFPVVVTVSEDQKQVSVALLLSVVKDEKQISVDKVLALMGANRQYAPAVFSYNSKHKRTELGRSFTSQELTSDLLKEAINAMATTAKDTQILWNFANSTLAIDVPPVPTHNASTLEPPASSTPVPSAKSPVTAVSGGAPASATDYLMGKWSSALSDKEAFAMQLGTDGRFVLVHVSNGKQTRSAGKFSHEKQTLTLIGDDGTQLSGTISSQTKQDFVLQLQTKSEKPTVLPFRRAK